MLILITGSPPNAYRRRRRRARTFGWLASAAFKEELDLYFVTPSNVVIQDGKPTRMNAFRSTQGGIGWTPVSTRIVQPIWIDFMYLKELAKHRGQYRKLKSAIRQSGSPCLNPVLPSKDVIYTLLASADLRPGCLPQTQPISSGREVLSFLERKSVAWLKPIRGSGGRNVIRIEKKSNQRFCVHSDSLRNRRVVRRLTARALERFIQSQLKACRYVVQEEMPLPRLPGGRRLDIRVTVQRDRRGKWRVTSTTLRRSGEGAIVTNHHSGGSSLSLNSQKSVSWLKSAGITDNHLKRSQQSALNAAEILQKAYPTLAYLGVDVAPTDQCCFVYDFNSRPGRDILTDNEVRLMMERLVDFTQYLRQSIYGR